MTTPEINHEGSLFPPISENLAQTRGEFLTAMVALPVVAGVVAAYLETVVGEGAFDLATTYQLIPTLVQPIFSREEYARIAASVSDYLAQNRKLTGDEPSLTQGQGLTGREPELGGDRRK